MAALKAEYPLNGPESHGADFGAKEDEPSLIFLPGELAKIVAEIKAIEFSPYLSRWIEDYEKVGQRGRFLWQWCLKGVGLTTLACVDPRLREQVIETKMLSILYGTLIDDIADREQDREMLQMAISLVSDDWLTDRLALWSGRRREYLEMIARLWGEVWSRCQSYPRLSSTASSMISISRTTCRSCSWPQLTFQPRLALT